MVFRIGKQLDKISSTGVLDMYECKSTIEYVKKISLLIIQI